MEERQCHRNETYDSTDLNREERRFLRFWYVLGGPRFQTAGLDHLKKCWFWGQILLLFLRNFASMIEMFVLNERERSGNLNTCICCCFTFWFYLNVYFFWFAGLSFKRNRKTTRAMCLPAWWRCIWRHKLAQCPSEWGWLLRRLLLLKRPFLSTNLLLKTLAICGVEQDSRRTLKCLHCFSFWNDSYRT